MNLVVAIYSAILFFVLSPGVLLRLPSNGSKFMVAGVHSLVFAVVLYFTAGFVWRMSMTMGMPMRQEGMDGLPHPAKKHEKDQ
uniref:Uncharacterized protein n=1 Tax=viral metagenome TaxID=1070528 RepID=A0A6C0L848_9ZZZZ